MNTDEIRLMLNTLEQERQLFVDVVFAGVSYTVPSSCISTIRRSVSKNYLLQFDHENQKHILVDLRTAYKEGIYLVTNPNNNAVPYVIRIDHERGIHINHGKNWNYHCSTFEFFSDKSAANLVLTKISDLPKNEMTAHKRFVKSNVNDNDDISK